MEAHSPTTTLGERLEAARQALTPVPSFRQVERRMFTRLGDYTPTSETLRRWHQPGVEAEKVDLVVLTCLADLYGITIRELSEWAADTLSDLGFPLTGWLSEPVAS